MNTDNTYVHVPSRSYKICAVEAFYIEKPRSHLFSQEGVQIRKLWHLYKDLATPLLSITIYHFNAEYSVDFFVYIKHI